MRWGSQSYVIRFPGRSFGFRKTFQNPLAAGVLRVGESLPAGWRIPDISSMHGRRAEMVSLLEQVVVPAAFLEVGTQMPRTHEREAEP